jgi:hypothetical protein
MINPSSPITNLDDLNIKIRVLSNPSTQDKFPIIKNHSCVYFNNSFVFFGGYNGKENINLIYQFSLSTKTFIQVKSTGDIPKPRNGHTATLVERKGQMIMIGGWIGEEFQASDEIFSLNLVNCNWKLIRPNPPLTPTNMHSANLYKDKIYIFRGGNGLLYLNDLISYNINTHNIEQILLKGKVPSPRANHMSEIIRDNLFIFGGWSGSHLLNDLYCINLTTNTSREIMYNLSVIPCSRAGGQMVVGTENNYLILFGGFKGNGNYLNDLCFFNAQMSKWVCFDLSAKKGGDKYPLPRAGHSMKIVNNKSIYIYGGSGNGGIYCNQMYEISFDRNLCLNEINSHSNKVFGKSRSSSLFFRSWYSGVAPSGEKLFNNLKGMYNNKMFSDVILRIEDKEIYAHKIVLWMISIKFQEMLEQDSEIEFLVIKGYKAKHVEVFMKLLYNYNEDELKLNEETKNDFISINNKKDNFDLLSINTNLLSNTSYNETDTNNVNVNETGQSELSSSYRNENKEWGLFDYFELLRLSDEFLVDSIKMFCERSILVFLNTDNFSYILAFAKKFSCSYLYKQLELFYDDNKSNIMFEEYSIIINNEDNSILYEKANNNSITSK